MRYDVLLCDADNTIFDFTKAEENAFAITCWAMGFESTPELLAIYSQINDALWKLLERGGITQSALRVQRYEEFLSVIGKTDCNAVRMAEIYAEKLGEQNVLIPGALNAIARWSKLVPVYIVTNGISRTQRSRMSRSPVREHIAGMIISEEIGAAKPDPRMLEIALAEANISDKSRALMLGDSLSSDMAAANNAGIDACWYNPKGLANTKGLDLRYVIADLDEVDAILSGKRED